MELVFQIMELSMPNVNIACLKNADTPFNNERCYLRTLVMTFQALEAWTEHLNGFPCVVLLRPAL